MIIVIILHDYSDYSDYSDYLVGGWPTPLKHMKVSWDDYPIYYE